MNIKRSYVIIIIVILIVSVFSSVLLVRGRENSHPGPIVWEEIRIEDHYIGGLSHLDLDDNMLYSNPQRNQLIAVDLEDEEVLWSHDHHYIYQDSIVNETITAISKYEDVVYIGDRIGNVAAIDAEYGEEIWQNRIHIGEVRSLDLSENRLFTGGGDGRGRGVRAVDIETGEEVMNHTHGGSAYSVHVENGVVYSAEANKIIAADVETGEKIWEHSHHDLAFSLTVEESVVYSGGEYGIIAYDAEKEEKIWEHTHHSERQTIREGQGINTIQVDEDVVYSGCGNGEIVAAEKETGEENWTFDHSSYVSTIQTTDDELYIYGRSTNYPNLSLTIREKEGNLFLGMSRTLTSWIGSVLSVLANNLWWIILGLLLIGSIVGIFLLPPKREEMSMIKK